MKKILLLPIALFMVSCSSVFTPKTTYVEKYSLTQEDMKNWNETITTVVKRESLIEDWYGSEDPINYLKKMGKLKEEDYNFFQGLSKKEVLTEEDQTEFNDLVKGYVSKLDRTFKLKNENIKNPKGLVETIANESIAIRLDNPSKHIMENVATTKEQAKIIAWSNQDELSEKDIKALRKMLNSFIKRSEFYDANSWQNREMSERAVEIIELSKKESISSDEKNNLNAKALYLAYSDFLSELEKWN